MVVIKTQDNVEFGWTQFHVSRGRCKILGMRAAIAGFGLVAILGIAPICAHGQTRESDVCPRPAAGSTVPEPKDLRSQNGVLRVELTYRTFIDGAGQARYCYLAKDGSQAPTLRVGPGDELILSLKNELPGKSSAQRQAPAQSTGHHPDAAASGSSMRMIPEPCAGAEMTPLSTNLHFHGLTVPSACHQDDVLNTMIEPGDPPFVYRFQIPSDEPPGLYWYHPHIHGFTKAQVLGGASGALIVEGIERANRDLA
jgi:FtsP/CotA-like multicopper oxidase with cupredoxin domain